MRVLQNSSDVTRDDFQRQVLTQHLLPQCVAQL